MALLETLGFRAALERTQHNKPFVAFTRESNAANPRLQPAMLMIIVNCVLG
jgi:hypothetical protein